MTVEMGLAASISSRADLRKTVHRLWIIGVLNGDNEVLDVVGQRNRPTFRRQQKNIRRIFTFKL